MPFLKGVREEDFLQIKDNINFLGSITGAGSGVVQGDVFYVDNSNTNASDNNSGRSLSSPKLTIQSAIDEADANSGSRVYVMGSSKHNLYPNITSGFHDFTGDDLYGVYREKLNIYYDDCGLQLIGINNPIITGNVGATEDSTGYVPTIQIGSYGVSSVGPHHIYIGGFLIGGYGDDGDDAADSNRYGVGIAIGEYDDTNYNDSVYYVTIEDCMFRSSNDYAAGQTNDEEIHTHIKGWGAERIDIRRCNFWAGQHAVAMNGSTLNNCMMWRIEDCYMMYQKTASLYSSASPFLCMVKDCVINPQSTGKELSFVGATASVISDCTFPLCASSAAATGGNVTSASLGTKTGWAVQNCSGQAGQIFEKS